MDFRDYAEEVQATMFSDGALKGENNQLKRKATIVRPPNRYIVVEAWAQAYIVQCTV